MKRVLLPLVLVLSSVLLAHSQQNSQTGSIEGSVVKYGTTDPIPRARVFLRASNNANSQTIAADDGGKFTFRDLAPGEYRITVTRDGFVAAEFGQRSPASGGVPINLSAQQQFKDAKVAMTPTGTISGRIVNRFGEPVGNANVQALRYSYQDGKRSLNPFQSIRTNDLGEYRLFWMQPGQYIISAQGTDNVTMDPNGTMFIQVSRGASGAAGGLGAGAVAAFSRAATVDFIGGPAGAAGLPVPPPPPPPPPPPGAVGDNSSLSLAVYYPGTTDVTQAQPVDLRAGGNLGGVNLTLVDAKPIRIRGQVLNGGRPASGAQVSIHQRNNVSGVMTIRSTPVNNDTGAFEIRNVAPGSYELVASLNGFGATAMLVGGPLGNAAGMTVANIGRGRVPGAPVMGGRVQVDVNQQDIEGVSILLETGFNIPGRITMDGQAGADLSAARIVLQAEPLIPQLSIPGANPQPDGTFTVEGAVPGTYRLSVTGLPRAYIKSARMGGEDVLNGDVRLDRAPNGSLEIVLGSSPGTVEATVVDDRLAPVPAVTVAIVPTAAAQEKRFELYRSATTDSSGKVQIQNVVPGEYKIFAWESVENGAWTDPAFMRAYQNNGVAVRVTEGGRGSAEIRVIPYRLQ